MLNGAAPYLGLKTESSLAMYSNLRTEGDATNHLLIRRTLRWWDYQQKLVRIVRSSHPGLQRIAADNLHMTWFEFRDFMYRNQDISVVYVNPDGQRIEVQRAGDLPDFRRPTPAFQRRLLFFRSPDMQDRPMCLH
jgi:hypothetical protein